MYKYKVGKEKRQLLDKKEVALLVVDSFLLGHEECIRECLKKGICLDDLNISENIIRLLKNSLEWILCE